MPPIRNYSKWNERNADNKEKIELKKKYFIIAEGTQTEKNYFKGFVDNFKLYNPNILIDPIFMEKTDNDKGITNPMALLEFAEEQKKNDSFCKETDKMIVVFDADIYKNDVETYGKVLNKADEYQDILAVTYPSFELFLLLHANNPKEILSINEKPILLNKTKSKNKTYIHGLCNQIFGFDVKSKGRVKVLSKDLLNAIKEEENINQDINDCVGKLSSNVGKILKGIIDGTL